MSPRRRLLAVVGCALCVLLVASLFPAADPRIETSSVGTGDGAGAGPTTGPDTNTPTPEQTPTTPEETESDTGPEIQPKVDGTPIPGETVRLAVDQNDLADSDLSVVDILVGGEYVGTVGGEESVPYDISRNTTELNLTVDETGDSVTVPVITDIQIETAGARAPGGEIEVFATAAGGYEVSYAELTVDGNQTTTTDFIGEATVTLPDSARETEIQAKRGVMAGNTTVAVQEPELSVTTPSPLLLPGFPAHVSVTVDNQQVENATVALSDGSQVTTGDHGARVTLPVTDEVTVSTTVGAEQASTTIGGLYLRTMFLVLVLPGIAIGFVWSYFRLVQDRRHVDFSGSVVTIAGLLGSVTAALAAVRIPRPNLSGVRIPRPSLGISGSSLSLPTGSVPSLPTPSLGGLFESVSSSSRDEGGGSALSSISSFFGSDDAGDEPVSTDEATPDSSTEESEATPDEHRQLRTTWHRFLDHVGIGNRETHTPGEATRVAIAAGYPRRSVKRLLGIFRDIEYGSEDPSPEDVSEAQSSLDTIAQHDPEEESQ